jgi:hypothetical protein
MEILRQARVNRDRAALVQAHIDSKAVCPAHTALFKIITGWLDTPPARDAARMRFVPLSEDDCARAAIAARAIASAHEINAQKHPDCVLRAHFEDQARRYRELARQFEEARSPHPSRA